MPLHRGLIPREGLCADVLARLIRRTALNPTFMLPLFILSRFTRRGSDFSALHPTAASYLRRIFYFSIVRSLSSWLSSKVRNNWVSDRYDWSREVVVVTGGAAGIGGAVVRLFDEMGVTVVVLDVQRMTFAVSSRVHHFHCDLRSPENIATVASAIRSKVGHPTVLINNAGVSRGKTILDSTPADVRFTFDVNSLAHYWTVREFLPHMVSRDHGMVVTVASLASWITTPNMVDYSASKAASLAFHHGLAAELSTHYNAPRVRTVVVHPGHTDTELFAGFEQGAEFLLPRLKPESIADAIVKQVLSGKSGQIVLPAMGWIVPFTEAIMPDWHLVRVRKRGQVLMKKWKGRQVIEDVDASYEGEGSTVLVS